MATHGGHQHHFEQGSQLLDTMAQGSQVIDTMARDAAAAAAAGSASSASLPAMAHMHMTFYWGPQVTVLFSSWTSTTWMQYSLLLLLCFGATLAAEALATYRARLVARIKQNPKYRSLRARGSAAGGAADQIVMPILDTPTVGSAGFADKLVIAVVSGLGTACSYLLMLVVMSFNIGVFIAVVAGHCAGIFLFGASRILGQDSQHVESAMSC